MVALPGVQADLVDGASSPKTATTETDGSYRVTGLSVGAVFATFRKSGYEPFEATVTATTDHSLDVVLRPCSPALATTSAAVPATGAAGSASVTVAAACSWTSASQASFITLTTEANRTGSGTVTYTVADNTTSAARTGTLLLAGQTFTVVQAGLPCTNATLSPTSASLSGAGGTQTVSLTIPAGCGWDASVGTFADRWVTVSPTTGEGSRTVAVTATPNSSGSNRSRSIAIAGRSFAVSQSTTAAPDCGATISPTSRSVNEAATTGTVSVTLPAGCGWTAGSGASFLTVTGSASGTGSGTVSYAVAALPTDTVTRNSTLAIAGHTFTLTQTRPSCGPTSVSLSPATGQSFTGAGGTATVNITIPAGCGWDASAGTFADKWVTVSPGTGVGPGTVTVTVTPNTTGLSRSRSIGIGGQPFMVSQSIVGAPDCSATISPTSRSITEAATTGTVSVTIPSGCGWTAGTEGGSFVSITSGASGTGPGTVAYFASALPTDLATRNTTLAIAGRTFTLTQTRPNCGPSAVSLSHTTQHFTKAGGTGTMMVTIPAGCGWQAFPVLSGGYFVYITSPPIPAPGAGANSIGPGPLTYTVLPNTTGNARSLHMSIASVGFVVTQDAGP